MYAACRKGKQVDDCSKFHHDRLGHAMQSLFVLCDGTMKIDGDEQNDRPSCEKCDRKTTTYSWLQFFRGTRLPLFRHTLFFSSQKSCESTVGNEIEAHQSKDCNPSSVACVRHRLAESIQIPKQDGCCKWRNSRTMALDVGGSILDKRTVAHCCLCLICLFLRLFWTQ